MNEKDKFDQSLNRRGFLNDIWKITEGISAAVLVGCNQANEIVPQVPATPETSTQDIDMFFIGPDVPTQMHK